MSEKTRKETSRIIERGARAYGISARSFAKAIVTPWSHRYKYLALVPFETWDPEKVSDLCKAEQRLNELASSIGISLEELLEPWLS